jgi:AcrR family transcriptional regulator
MGTREGARDRIREVVLRLMATDEAGKASVKRISDEAGINRSTFYYYFSSPQDVIDSIVEDFSRDCLHEFEVHPLVEDDESEPDIIRDYWTSKVTFFYANKDLSRIMMRPEYRGALEDTLVRIGREGIEGIDWSYPDTHGRLKPLTAGMEFDFFPYRYAHNLVCCLDFLVRRNFVDDPETVIDMLCEMQSITYMEFRPYDR